MKTKADILTDNDRIMAGFNPEYVKTKGALKSMDEYAEQMALAFLEFYQSSGSELTGIELYNEFINQLN